MSFTRLRSSRSTEREALRLSSLVAGMDLCDGGGEDGDCAIKLLGEGASRRLCDAE